jgi:hypothetical protein
MMNDRDIEKNENKKQKPELWPNMIRPIAWMAGLAFVIVITLYCYKVWYYDPWMDYMREKNLTKRK